MNPRGDRVCPVVSVVPQVPAPRLSEVQDSFPGRAPCANVTVLLRDPALSPGGWCPFPPEDPLSTGGFMPPPVWTWAGQS